MTDASLSPFPTTFQVVCRGARACAWLEGRVTAVRRATPPPLVLRGPGVEDAAARRGLRNDTLVAAAVPVLDLLTSTQGVDVDDPESIGAAYLDAARDMRAPLDLLQMAHDVVPASDADARRFLAHAVATAATQALRKPGTPTPPASGTHALAQAAATGLPTADAMLDAVDAASAQSIHALLDACFEDVAAWWRMRGSDFEPRDGQRDMAHAVLESFLSRTPLVVEAGTGTGKSLAYALPAIVFAWWRGERVVLSTHTRNLQQQLVAHDLPALWSCFALQRAARPDGCRGLRFAKLLGRANYVCRTALSRCARDAVQAGGSLEVARLVLAVARSPDGALDEVLPGVRPELVHEVRSRRETCVGRACRSEPACPVYRAREGARDADIVVVNHALLFADASNEGNILGDYGALVLDEAHNLEPVATESLCYAVGRMQADALLATGRRMESELRGLTPGPETAAAQRAFEDFATHWSAARDGIARWLEALDTALPRAARVRRRQRYRDPDEVFGACRDALDDVWTAFGRANASARVLREAVQEVVLQEESRGVLELTELLDEMRLGIQFALDFLVRAADDGWVYYLDFSAPGDALHEIVAAPLDVSHCVERLLGRVGARVYTSATLFVENDSGYFRRAVGLPGDVRVMQVDSPFDYASQCSVVHTMALGDYRDPAFVPQLAELLAALHRRVGRRTLVLLTSYTMLRDLHAALRDALGMHAPILAQGISAPRERLAQQLATTPGAMLLGTRSFWEGVDLPREALEVLVLAKLPFAVPDEPLVEARCERLRAHGDDPFGEFVLPDAVLRFRQGFGRLIRSRSDRGAVLVVDGRLDTHAYGESFATSLPVRVERLAAADDVVEHVADWLGAAVPRS